MNANVHILLEPALEHIRDLTSRDTRIQPPTLIKSFIDRVMSTYQCLCGRDIYLWIFI